MISKIRNININMKNLIPLDYFMVATLSYIISQSIILGDFLWMGIGLWCADVYINKRGGAK